MATTTDIGYLRPVTRSHNFPSCLFPVSLISVLNKARLCNSYVGPQAFYHFFFLHSLGQDLCEIKRLVGDFALPPWIPRSHIRQRPHLDSRIVIGPRRLSRDPLGFIPVTYVTPPASTLLYPGIVLEHVPGYNAKIAVVSTTGSGACTKEEADRWVIKCSVTSSALRSLQAVRTFKQPGEYTALLCE